MLYANHFSIFVRSYVWSSVVMTGSLITSIVTGHWNKDAAPHVRLCGKFTTQPQVRCTCGRRTARTGTKDAAPHVRLCGELTAQLYVRSPCGPVRHPCTGRSPKQQQSLTLLILAQSATCFLLVLTLVLLLALPPTCFHHISGGSNSQRCS